VRILFWGTPTFALPSLRALSEEGHHVVAVVTQPDRPAGRGRRMSPSPVKALALEEGIPVLTPERPRGEAFLAELRALKPELSVVVAYGHILRPEVLDLPPLGSVNVHASLLPELRGAAPINWAVARGLPVTGVTLMRMTPGMDEGPILLQVDTPIGEEESASDLYDRLSEMGAAGLVEALAMMAAGLMEAREQDHERATYAPKLDRAMARVDWTLEARRVSDFIRGMDSVPGAWTELDGEPIKLFRSRPVEVPRPGIGDGPEEAPPAPGTLVGADPRTGVRVACGSGMVDIGELQPPGRRRMEAGAWLSGQDPVVGRRFR
jgi:methionyl-tRNA formyltransferase